MCVEKSVNKVLKLKKPIICSCEDPKLVKAESALPRAARQHQQVPVAVAQEGRKWNLILVFPLEKQGKTHSCEFGSASTELAAVGRICFMCFGLMFSFSDGVSVGEAF